MEAEELVNLITTHWGYREVTIRPHADLYECRLCRCLVTDKRGHAEACLGSMPDEEKTVFIGEFVAQMRNRGGAS